MGVSAEFSVKTPSGVRPRTERMKVLPSSSGSDATLAQNAGQHAILLQVFLDVRDVEHGDGRPLVFQILTDRADRSGPGEVPHERDDQVVGLELFQEPERLVAGQVAAQLAHPVGRHHQVGVGRLSVAAALVTRRRVLNLRAVDMEGAIVVLKPEQVAGIEHKACVAS